MKKDKKLIVSVIAAGAIIYFITKFLKKSTNTIVNVGSYSKIYALEDPKFIFKNARIDQEKMMQFPNYTWKEIIDYIAKYPKDYETILEFFSSCTRQVQAAFLAVKFKLYYEKDLYKYLQQNLTIKQYNNIAKVINDLPEVFTPAKQGEYGNRSLIKPLK